MRDERQDIRPDAMRFAANDDDAFHFAMLLEKVFAIQQSAINGLAFAPFLAEKGLQIRSTMFILKMEPMVA